MNARAHDDSRAYDEASHTDPRPVYLDHNGTTPVAAEVAEAMWPYLTVHCGNPSSATAAGRLARRAIDEARDEVAALIDASPDEITFTSGGTEANNLAIRGVTSALRRRESAPSARVVTTAVEHPATAAPMALLAADGWDVVTLPVGADGHVGVDDDVECDAPGTPAGTATGGVAFASIILAQNETGAIQPVRAVADAVHTVGGLVHTDAAQAAGKIGIDVDALGVDLLSLAGHKMYAPKAVGALYVRRGTPIDPLVIGAEQERGLRPGTENVAGIVGLGRAAQLARTRLHEDAARMSTLRDELWSRLTTAAPGLVRISPAEDCLPNTLMLAMPGRLGRDVLARATDVEASTGSACHAGVDSPAATPAAMGLPDDVALGAIRLTLGRATTSTDVERAAASLVAALNASDR